MFSSRRLTLFLLLWLCGGRCMLLNEAVAQEAKSPHFPSEFQRRCLAATVRLRTESSCCAGQCSGAVVGRSSDGIFVATAPHCFLDGPVRIRATIFGDNYPSECETFENVEILCSDENADFALVHVQGDYRGPVLRIAPRNYQPQPGEQLLSVGCNAGGQASCEVHPLVTEDAEYWVVQQAGITGRSGGPLISADGYVLGSCSCTNGTFTRYSHTDRLHRLLDAAGLSHLFDTTGGASRPRLVVATPHTEIGAPECSNRRCPLDGDESNASLPSLGGCLGGICPIVPGTPGPRTVPVASQAFPVSVPTRMSGSRAVGGTPMTPRVLSIVIEDDAIYVNGIQVN